MAFPWIKIPAMMMMAKPKKMDSPRKTVHQSGVLTVYGSLLPGAAFGDAHDS